VLRKLYEKIHRHDNDSWGSFIDVKINAPEVLAKEIKKLKGKPRIFPSSVCDPYQAVVPSRLSRRQREILEEFEEG